jgi:hypothetical protein
MLAFARVFGLVAEDGALADSGLADHLQVVVLSQCFLHCSYYAGTIKEWQRRRAPTPL